MLKKFFFYFLFIIGLIYIIYPTPSRIEDFAPLPRSYKSNEPGDTIQNPNIAAYYSFFRRDEIIDFYKTNYQNLHFCNFFLNPLCFIPPIRLNHPPEYAYQYIRDQQVSTFLEEYTYPLRDSLFVNGYEILRPDGTSIFYSVPRLEEAGKSWPTKVTLRLYTSNILVRIIVWAAILISMKNLFRLGMKIAKE